MALLSAGVTDIGRKRKTNQDSIYVNAKEHVFVVADGMGGHNGGDIASALAVQAFPEFMADNKEQLEVKELMQEAVRHANKSIKIKSDEDELLQGMGTTLVGMYFKGDTLYISNVGDSRSYLVNDHKLYQLTKDHSLVQEKLNIGLYNRAQAQADPQKNVLVRTVGFEEEIEVDVFNYKVSRNDLFLSCSDGLHGKVSDADIVYIINQEIPEPSKATQECLQRTAERLVAQANENGGQDNISVVLVLAK